MSIENTQRKIETNLVQAHYTIRRGHFDLDALFTFPEQSVTALFGPSGSGKTTLLRCIAGLDKANESTLELPPNSNLNQLNETQTYKKNCAYVFQDAALFPHLNVEKNLLFGFKRSTENERFITFSSVVELLDIVPLLHRSTSDLSAGQKQRIAIARALLSQPALLLMDEPLANLDSNSRLEILPYLEALNKTFQLPIIYVSHSPDELLRIAQHMVLMDDGRVLAYGDINTLLTRDDLPLIHLNEACAVIDATLESHLTSYELSILNITAGHLTVPFTDMPIGSAARVRISAKDVSITLSKSTDTSITNILPATVDSIIDSADASRKTVKLRVSDDIILAQLTAYSVEKLSLESGKSVYAQIKSVVLMR